MLLSQSYSRTEPSVEPVTVGEFKRQARIDAGDTDDELSQLLQDARLYAEDVILWRALITQTCIDKFDRFSGEMELHFAPVQSITTVAYTDAAGDSQTASSSLYELGEENGKPILRLAYGQSWPATRSHPDAVTVTYVAGYGAAGSNVPKPIRRGIVLLAEWMNEGSMHDVTYQAALNCLMPYARAGVIA